MTAADAIMTAYVNNAPESAQDQLPEGSEIHLDVNDDDHECTYYVADHHQCSIGWLDAQLTTEALGLPQVHSYSHLVIKKLEEYSLHLEYFPCHVRISPQLVESVKGQLAFNCVDATTSQGTTSPYTASDCERFLKVLKHAPESSAERNWIIGRISSVLARSRFMNFYGEDAARLDRSQSVNPVQQVTSRWRSWVSRSLLFDMPLKYQSRLEALWVDRIVYVTMWQQCMQALVSELRDTLCMAIFVWFASLTSLLLPTNAGAPFRAMTMTTMILSFSSAISAIIHIRRHRNRPSDTATDASHYLENSEHSEFGLQPLAMILTIPSALLTWSFITCGLSIVMLILSCHDVVISAMLTGFWVVMAHVVVMVVRFPRSQTS
jgi:hypothetical protein